MTNEWIKDVGFVPISDAELLRVRQCLADKSAALRSEGESARAELFETLLGKLGGMQGRDYKLAPRTPEDEVALER